MLCNKTSLLICFNCSTCGSDEDFKTFDTCELHGKIEYPPGSTECPEIYRALDGVRYIAESTKREEESCKVTKINFSTQNGE